MGAYAEWNVAQKRLARFALLARELREDFDMPISAFIPTHNRLVLNLREARADAAHEASLDEQADREVEEA